MDSGAPIGADSDARLVHPPSHRGFIMSETVRFDRALITRYDRSGPRYTSYPTAPQFNEAFDNEAYRAAAVATNEDPMPTPLSAYVHLPFCQSLGDDGACKKISTGPTEQRAH